MTSWEVTHKESGTKLLTFLKEKLGASVSSRELKKALDDNLCQINRRVERFGTFQLGPGDQVTLNKSFKQKNDKSISFKTKHCLYEDDDLLIYDKPSGIASDSPLLLKALQRGLSFLALTHRLDRDTTGALIFAKTPSATEKMMALFKQRQVLKTYLAIVDGTPRKPSGLIDNFLGPLHRYQGQTIQGVMPPPKGLQAITAWECIQRGNGAALLRCFPKTGRTHQLRVHLSTMGHPILGDHQYGKEFRCPYQPERYLLHAESVSFTHPCKGTLIKVEAPQPEDFSQAIDQLLRSSPR